MAIEFKHRGRTWRADTPEEAIRLREKLEQADQELIEMGEAPSDFEEPVWTADSVHELLRKIGPYQKTFLRVLHEPLEVASDKIIKEIGLKSEVHFAGVLSGLSKQVRSLNLKPWDLYSVRVEWDGKAKTRYFRLANDFRWVASELGWPDKWQ